MIVEWVLEAWSQLAQDIVVKSFKVCALNLAVDGSEDSMIHCFKKGQPCELGLDQLKAQLPVLHEPDQANPFLNVADSDIDGADGIGVVEMEDEEVDIEI